MLLTAPWRLSLLFLVSGAATAFLIGKSASGFLGTRSWRLLVPLAFGMLVVVVPQAYYEVVEKMPGGYHDGYLADRKSGVKEKSVSIRVELVGRRSIKKTT